MRTSYQRVNSTSKDIKPENKNIGSVQDNIDLEDESLRASLRDAYVAINSAVIESRKQQELKEYSEALEAQADSSIYNSNDQISNYGDDTDINEPSEKEQEILKAQKKKRRKIVAGVSVASVVVVAVAGFFIYKSFFTSNSSVGAVETQISKLYTSEHMTDIKEGVTQDDLNKFYLELLEAQDNGDDVDAAMEELDTIGYFLSDKSTLERYGNDSYDLTTSGMMDNISDIKDNAQGYSVPGLALTVNDMASGIEDDYNYFIDLRSELNGIVDVINFDEDGYASKIDLVSHTPNKTELEATYDKIVVDKQAAIAQQELQDAQDEQAKQEAQAALEQAQELQRQTQQELENTKKQLEEAAQKAAEQEKENEVLDSNPIATPTSVEPTVTDTPVNNSESIDNQKSLQNGEEKSETTESTSAEE